MLKYFFPDDGETSKNAVELPGKHYKPIDTDYFAQACANHCYSHRDGQEWSWPVKFGIVDFESGSVEYFKVHVEFNPSFWAEKVNV